MGPPVDIVRIDYTGSDVMGYQILSQRADCPFCATAVKSYFRYKDASDAYWTDVCSNVDHALSQSATPALPNPNSTFTPSATRCSSGLAVTTTADTTTHRLEYRVSLVIRALTRTCASLAI